MIILVWRNEEPARRGVFIYVAITHLAGAGAWVALLVLAEHGALGGHALDASSSSGALVAVAALIGFGAKAGVMPLHVWLPRAHPLAPAHVSALMSGVMIKVALYGLVRVLVEWLDRPPLWLGVTVVALGAVSALGGSRLRPLPARAQAPARTALDREHRHHPARARRRARAARARSSPPGQAWRSLPRCCTRSTTPSSRRCCSSARGVRARRPRASSWIASAACCAACRGRARAFLVGAGAIAGHRSAERLRVGVADAPGAPPPRAGRIPSPPESRARSRSVRSR